MMYSTFLLQNYKICKTTMTYVHHHYINAVLLDAHQKSGNSNLIEAFIFRFSRELGALPENEWNLLGN